jgi:type VI secretion system secreted protein VgrG
MSTTQATREIALTCALGPDVLLLRRMRGHEALSELSEYNVDLYSERADLQLDELLGTPVTIRVNQPRGGQRFFSGFITRFALTGRQGRYATYQATVRPWLWFLTRASDCRIFQDKSVLDIVKAVFAPYAIADVDTSGLSASYGAYPYCVQYRETDFDFVSRLLEREGIYYYFRSSDGRHTMVLADSYAAHAPIPGYASLVYMPAAEHAMRGSEVVYTWSMGGEIEPGLQSLQDFDFEKPAANLLVKSTVVHGYAHGRNAQFDYPGGYTGRAAGEARARVRLDARHTSYERVQAVTQARGLFPGGLFKLTEHARSDQNRDYLIVSAEYILASDAYEPTRHSTPEPVLTCSFSAIARQHEFRPPARTRIPVVQGPQTAIVVGKAGEEIWTDKYGRIKVQFHWDRVGQDDERSSCWVRVAQGWAGKRWGSLFTPRIGQEVIVSFLEGDPDRPLVTGSVYNADNMPPYPLPAQATRSTVKSHSTVGGNGSNELRFEDKKGAEQLYLHAERDLEERVRRDALAWMGRDRHAIVKRDSFEEIGGNANVQIHGDRRERVTGALGVVAGRALALKSGMKAGLEGGLEVHIKAGMNVVIEAGASITLKAGAAWLNIGPATIAASTMPLPIPQLATVVNAAVLAANAEPPLPPPAAPHEADDGTR